ncbi:MAG: TylF/MycF family methyltransferase [Cytophagaceae bacterium]|jgi:hypothetical protein|nr:TylF/MycF family methyltransferase [Cytophagaceae bacterium]
MGIISRYILKPFRLKLEKLKDDEDFIDDPLFLELYKKCKPYTMTSMERMYALYHSVCYLVQHKIQGDIVECGVWRGGSSMMIALTLKALGDTNRRLYLYDTFEGMSEPTELDKTKDGENAAELLQKNVNNKENSVWCYAGLEDVKQNMNRTAYPAAQIQLIKGKVEDSIPGTMPASLALLRLDTDWYESTRHELLHLYPLLCNKGVLIIDDYGHWEGARKAVDEYFANQPVLLNRIDYTGRIAIKVE